MTIRECGKDEYWLQDQIATNPKILGLGDLVLVEREKRQLSGGRLDLLLKSRDGESVFEVEVMLGETDGSHIHRTIEYWDLEESLDPKRNHFPVLVAEEVTRRFFNVIYRLSRSIPFIAIKVNVVTVEGKKALHFTTILNALENAKSETRRPPEFKGRTEPRESVSEDDWVKKSPATVECAKKFHAVVSGTLPWAKLKFFKFGLVISVGSRTYFWFKNTSADKTVFNFWVDESRIERAKQLLEQGGISPVVEDGYLRARVDVRTIETNKDLFAQLGPIVDESRRNEKASEAGDQTE